jgi:uncharacterized protein YbjT (DUF2867 family)
MASDEAGAATARATFLVTGVSGNIGAAVAAALLANGHEVRGVIRDEGAVPGLPEGVWPVIGDLDRAETLIGALDGVEGLFLLPGYSGAADLLAAAHARGVRRLAQLSGGSAGSRDLSNAVTAYMVGAEDIAVESGLAWTILRPTAFMSNTLRWLPQLTAGDELRLPFTGVRTAVIDPADIGAVAAAALTGTGHAERVYRISGPESLLPADQVAMLAAELDRPLRLVAQTDDEAHADMLARMPSEYVDAFFDFYARGSLDESEVLPTVEEVTGRPPNTFRNWAHANAGRFARPAGT